MGHLPHGLLDGCPPAWLRKVEARVIARVFARALGVDAPSMRRLGADEALATLQTFTAVHMKEALASGRVPECRTRLGAHARILGTRVRRALPAGHETREQVVRYLYRGIRIELSGSMPGALRFGPCSFARYYSPACCALMSAFDEGFICGIMGLSGPFVFESRLTEGGACCRAHIC